MPYVEQFHKVSVSTLNTAKLTQYRLASDIYCIQTFGEVLNYIVAIVLKCSEHWLCYDQCWKNVGFSKTFLGF